MWGANALSDTAVRQLTHIRGEKWKQPSPNSSTVSTASKAHSQIVDDVAAQRKQRHRLNRDDVPIAHFTSATAAVQPAPTSAKPTGLQRSATPSSNSAPSAIFHRRASTRLAWSASSLARLWQ